jgi:malate dehydrogenase
MTTLAAEVSGLPRNRVMGQAGNLDSARFMHFIAEKAGVDILEVEALTLGSHGETMVPVPSQCRVAGKPLTEVLDADTIEELVDRTRKGGGEIVAYLKTGSAYYAPAAGAVQMAEAIVKDKRRILPCSCFLEGEYGEEGLFIGVPCRVGKGGMEGILEVPLSDDEVAALKNSMAAVKGTMEDLAKLDY